ncbi:uncharacterized protein K460DRAFT_282081 [Cucurbitaria berberidis CBS 394.84]|uniref:Nuclear GTPase SLIP-GC n=1 Tax=Cucurbitaria berberidis CBS 394.84 TaxID=1168544 RepID=A0A9P4L735_9PLEO|nr:uncharacterized protein K460DRAFT_282081 [Cucurbitaria berberidis CBS 394.84]KAF1844626.1 hypothetical protein K460DRAFT_282081 [Cucurbitaria berberidis CBS 394.84]
MMDWDGFQQRARAVVPSQELKPKRCWIGVLNHEKGLEEELEGDDFVWMIGHSKIPIQMIIGVYEKRHGNRGFQLRFKDVKVDKSDNVRSFLRPGDDLVLFLATDLDTTYTRVQSSDPQLFQGSTYLQADIASRTQGTTHTPLASRAKDGSATAGAESSSSTRAQSMVPPMTPIAKYQENGTIGSPQFPSNRESHVPTSGRVESSSNTVPEPLSTQHAQNASKGAAQPAPYQSPYSELKTVIDEPAIGPKWNGVKEERHSPPPYQTPVKESAHLFDPDSLFNREPSPLSQDESPLTDRHIRTIIDQQNPDILDAGVARSMVVLEKLRQKFLQYALFHVDAQSWVLAIEKLVPLAERKRTVVGVVGNTGAGKSSVINAMLDEERLVPTNCMRACTAVVTEISWNNSTDTSSKYRAEIEFISPKDWEKELNVLTQEFLTENGSLSREASDPNSDAGIAWAKFHSVYPKLPKDSLGELTVPGLMSERGVVNILGTTKEICTAMPGPFYRELQKYVDSREKITKRDKEKDKSKQREKKTFEMEYWPLIKVVKIYTKSSALSTGAVIVDLPGIHDSNAARSAVAQGYMKQCTGLWIVAPINRAVDDKAAKTLLGDSFKRQLKYDGGFSGVTFICSKTDDISITEAMDSLELGDEVAEFEEQEDQYKQQIETIQDKITELRESQAAHQFGLRNTADEIEVWEGLQENLNEGNVVFAPLPKTNKRRKGSLSKQSRKKRQTYDDDDDDDDDFLASDDDRSGDGSDFDDEVMFEETRTRLTEADIKNKLKELRETKKSARREGSQIKASIEELRPSIRDIQMKIADIKGQVSRICIAGRNEYSKTAIQQDFAAGIKEIDQENAAEEDEDNFNPDEELRDYDKVARSLPVFCVSGRAYQKMCGRLQKDDNVPGFLTPEETEIPQLQAHCRKLTEGGRIQTCRTFLLSLCQLLTTFNLWVSADGTDAKMTDDDKRKQVEYLKRRLKELDTGLREAVRACIQELWAEMKNQIFDKYPELINDAIEAAPNTASAWGYKDMGGLAWATYKAVVRRNGAYHSSTAGHRDFNADLVNPILKKLATGWERTFTRRLPRAFDTYIANSGKILHAFHKAIEERAHENGVSLANLSILKTQIQTYEQLYKDLGAVLIEQMTALQREANRDFTPTIANIMHSVYDVCAFEHGQGSYKRMKEHMKNHVEHERHEMFYKATRTVEKHLGQMCKALQNSMETKADDIFLQMNRDYMQVLGGVVHHQPLMIQTTEETNLRSDVREILRGIEAEFEPIANGQLDVLGGVQSEGLVMDTQEPTIIEDEHDGVFESAMETTDVDANEDSFVDGNNDTMLTEPTPQKSTDKDAGTHDGDSRSLPTPFSGDDMDEGT